MKIKNIISILLAVALIISLSGCAAQSVPASIDEEGRFIYSIVRPGGTPITLIDDSARIIRSAIKENFGVTLTYIKDTALEEFNSDYEILIGETNREETAKAIKLLDDNRLNNNNDFIVAVINNKICIYSKNDSVLYTAAEWFVNNFCQSLESWQKLKTGYKFIYEHDVGSIYANKANGRDVGTYDVVLPRYASYLYCMVADEIIAHYKSIGYGPVWYEDIIDKEVEYEILIGDCDRPASKSVTVEDNNYVIKVIGNKIVAKGGNDLATREAVLKLYEEILKGKETGTGFDWSDGYTINGKYVGDKASDYTLNWYDEFEGSAIDFNKWSDYDALDQNTPSQNGGTLYWQNCYGESKYTGDGMMDLIYTSDGKLHLGTQNINNKDFACAIVSTLPTMIYRYGIVEVREKFAPEPAACSVWQNGAKTSGDRFKHWTVNGVSQNRASMTEIDIFEDYGQTKYFTSTLHNWWSHTNPDGTTTIAKDTVIHLLTIITLCLVIGMLKESRLPLTVKLILQFIIGIMVQLLSAVL